MTELPRETRVLDAVVSLVDSLLDDFDVVDLLTELTEQCAQLLDVAAAGLLLATPRRQLQLMAATSEKIHDLELFQLQADQGPCLDCYRTAAPISVADAFTLLRRHARTHGDHLTELSRRLITEPEARQTILAAMTQMMGAPAS